MSKIKFSHPSLEYTAENDGKDYIIVTGKMEVCPTCNGTGSHVRHDLDDSAMVDNMMEDGDHEGIEAYHDGAFDEICTQCGGNNVVAIPELPEWANTAVSEWERDEQESRLEAAAERHMGA